MSLRDLSDRELRERAGAKWTAAGPDVLPAWVAEMDFALAEPITAALHDAVDRGAVGYSPSDARTGVAEALASVRHRPVVLGPRPGARGPRPRRHERDRARAAHAVRGRPGGRADARRTRRSWTSCR